MWIVYREPFGNYSWQIFLFCFSMYVSNFDLKFLGIILVCAVNMHDFFSDFFAMFKFEFEPHVTVHVTVAHVTWSQSPISYPRLGVQLIRPARAGHIYLFLLDNEYMP